MHRKRLAAAALTLVAVGCTTTPRRTVGPATSLYPVYVADPRRSTTAIVANRIGDSDVPAAGDSRYTIRIGERIGLVRWHEPGELDYGTQLDIEVGFTGQFDRENSTDNIGWDGLYALVLSRRTKGSVGWRVGISHDSAHLGDEYIEETGRERLNYTREELLAGVSYEPHDDWRAYAELGWGYKLRNEEVMDPGRLQAGLEYEPTPTWGAGQLGPYAALDVSSFEEDDWSTNVTVQTGVAFHPAREGSVFRLGLEFYDGRTPLGELFETEQTHFGLGIWIDL